MALLPASGLVHYNGFDFPVETETTEVDTEPVYDQANRVVIYLRYAFSFRSIIYALPGQTIDATMTSLRKVLMRPAGQFRYDSKGFGSFNINAPNRVVVAGQGGAVAGASDVAWGPTPKRFRWKPRGNDRAAELIYTIEIHIPECDIPTYAQKLLAFNYRLDIDIDRSGYTTRNYSGYIEAPMTRSTVSDRSLPDMIDAYYERIIPDLPVGFRRSKRPRVISEDKRRMDFSIVDEEMPADLQEDVVECKATHTIRCQNMNMYQWFGTIEADYELRKDFPKLVAARKFLDLVVSRTTVSNLLQEMKEVQLTGDPTKDRKLIDQRNKDIGILPLSWGMKENIFGKSGTFTFSYSLVTSLASIFSASAFWTPVPSSTVPNAPVSWALWAASLADLTQSPRGNVGMTLLQSDDALLSICDTNQTVQLKTVIPPVLSVIPMPDVQAAFPYPDEISSWIDYQCELEVEFHTGKIIHNPLPTQAPTGDLHTWPPPSQGNTSDYPQLETFFANPMTGATMQSLVDAKSFAANQVQTVQQQSGPVAVATLRGFAMRAGFKIAPPQLWKFAGQDATPLGGRFGQAVVGVSTMPVVGAWWELQFAIPNLSAATSLGLPPNPALLVEG